MNYLRTFWHMIAIDLKIYKNFAFDYIINCLIWALSYIVISNYIMPKFGTSSSYGILTAAGLVASAGIFQLYSGAVQFVIDITGDKIINSYLILPIPTWLVFVRIASINAFKAMVPALFVLPLIKLTLWHQFDFSAIAWFKFILIFFVNFLFYGIFSLYIASLIHHMEKISNIWMRIVFPLFIFSGFQFTWYSFYAAAPSLAIIDLLNPFVYGTEGTRAALLGQEGFINYWYCIAALLIFSYIFFILGLRRMKRRLDFV